jgi:hypothetical protein
VFAVSFTDTCKGIAQTRRPGARNAQWTGDSVERAPPPGFEPGTCGLEDCYLQVFSACQSHIRWRRRSLAGVIFAELGTRFGTQTPDGPGARELFGDAAGWPGGSVGRTPMRAAPVPKRELARTREMGPPCPPRRSHRLPPAEIRSARRIRSALVMTCHEREGWSLASEILVAAPHRRTQAPPSRSRACGAATRRV